MVSVDTTTNRLKLPTFKNLSFQLITYFLGIALLPLIIVSYINYKSASNELQNISLQLLWNMSQKQKSAIVNYMDNQQRTLGFLALSPDIERPFVLLNKIKQSTQKSETMDYLDTMRHKLEPTLRDFLDKTDFKQLYLVNLDGGILLNIGENKFNHANVSSGSLMNTELSNIFQRTLMFLTPQISNFGKMPSGNEYELFIATPVFSERRLVGILIAQFDLTALFNLVNHASNLIGTTGETLIGAIIGNVTTILNPSRFDDSKPFMALSEASDKTLNGNSFIDAMGWERGVGKLIDYRGQTVLAAWEYMPNLRWGLVVKMDMSEVMIPAIKLRQISIIIALIVCLAVLLVGWAITHSLTKPIFSLTKVATTIAAGDLTPTIGTPPNNEIGILANAIKTMSSSLKVVVSQIKNWGKELVTTTEEVSKVMEDQSLAAQETKKTSIDITTSSKQISEVAKELSGTMHDVSNVVKDTALLAESGIDGLHIMETSMNELTTANTEVSQQLNVIREKADAISSIITTMTKVADQTNLLSLNAAIEARQAGTYGKGFKVVALEIKRLADQVATSTLEIESMITEMSKAVHKGVSSMQHLSEKVKNEANEIANVSTHLTSVIQQVQGLPVHLETVVQGMETQSRQADEIKSSIAHLSESAQLTVSSMEKTTKKLLSLKKAAGELQLEISKFKDR